MAARAPRELLKASTFQLAYAMKWDICIGGVFGTVEQNGHEVRHHLGVDFVVVEWILCRRLGATGNMLTN